MIGLFKKLGAVLMYFCISIVAIFFYLSRDDVPSSVVKKLKSEDVSIQEGIPLRTLLPQDWSYLCIAHPYESSDEFNLKIQVLNIPTSNQGDFLKNNIQDSHW